MNCSRDIFSRNWVSSFNLILFFSILCETKQRYTLHPGIEWVRRWRRKVSACISLYESPHLHSSCSLFLLYRCIWRTWKYFFHHLSQLNWMQPSCQSSCSLYSCVFSITIKTAPLIPLWRAVAPFDEEDEEKKRKYCLLLFLLLSLLHRVLSYFVLSCSFISFSFFFISYIHRRWLFSAYFHTLFIG